MRDCENYVFSVRRRSVQSGDGSDVGIQKRLIVGSLLRRWSERSGNEC